jgi:hypothetical protein
MFPDIAVCEQSADRSLALPLFELVKRGFRLGFTLADMKFPMMVF